MAIKYLRGIYRFNEVRNTRPLPGFRFPLGIEVGVGSMDTANSIATTNASTFDMLLVAGGAGGAGRQGTSPESSGQCAGGSGGAGGVRVFSANNLTDISQFKNLCNISSTNQNFIPVTVGGGSCFGSIVNISGGGGGAGGRPYTGGQPGKPGGPGGSGGSGGLAHPAGTGGPPGAAGLGTAGQGCNGSASAGISGSATATASRTGGVTTAITGVSIRYGDGASTGCGAGAANRGNGGGGAPGGRAAGGAFGGGSGIVAIRYRNPASPTTPLATGGSVVCCTGGCIIHIYNASGFFNVATEFSIN